MPGRYRILAGTSEAGGAECLLPVVRLLRDRGNHVSLVAGPTAAAFLARRGLPPAATAGAGAEAALLVERWMAAERPDAVLTGLLGEKDHVDYALIRAAKGRGIPVLSILDSWMNYADRLADPATGDPLGLLPSRLAVMDDLARAEMVGEGIPEAACVVTGHPKFDALQEIGRRRGCPAGRGDLRERYGIGRDRLVIVFFSQPVARYYPDKALGYDEADVFAILFSAFARLRAETPCTLVFKEHPRGASLKDRGAYPQEDVLFMAEADADELLVLADAVVGMSGTLLVFAAAAGVPVFSLQPNLRAGMDMNVLTRRGYLPPLDSWTAFYGALSSLLLRGGVAAAPRAVPGWLKPDGLAGRRVAELLEQMIEERI